MKRRRESRYEGIGGRDDNEIAQTIGMLVRVVHQSRDGHELSPALTAIVRDVRADNGVRAGRGLTLEQAAEAVSRFVKMLARTGDDEQRILLSRISPSQAKQHYLRGLQRRRAMH